MWLYFGSRPFLSNHCSFHQKAQIAWKSGRRAFEISKARGAVEPTVPILRNTKKLVIYSNKECHDILAFVSLRSVPKNSLNMNGSSGIRVTNSSFECLNLTGRSFISN